MYLTTSSFEFFCRTRADVYQLLLDHPEQKFFPKNKPNILHTFTESLPSSFITIDRDSGYESFVFHLNKDELGIIWEKFTEKG